MGIKSRGISLKFKFVIIILVMVLVLFATLGSICYAVLGKVLDEASAKTLNLTVQQYALKVDNKMSRIEDTVNGVDAYVAGSLDSAYEISDSSKREQFQKEFEQYFVSIAGSNNDVIACYMTFNPELTGNGTEGFYYSKNADGVFVQAEATDVLNFSEGNSWFYQPVENQEAMWLDPYYSEKCDALLIS